MVLKGTVLKGTHTTRDNSIYGVCPFNFLSISFREGNGRATRFFFEELVFVAGYELNWPEISKEQWIEANVQGYLGDTSFLELIFDMAIS